MTKLSRDEFYFALSIDGITPIDDYETFVNKNRNLCDLYRMLTKDGIHCDYECAYHSGEDVIPGIIFPKYYDGKEIDPGLPGTMVICEDGKLQLLATPSYSGIEQAIEFEVPVNDNDWFKIFEHNEGLDYLFKIFSTKSICHMYNFIRSILEPIL